MSRRTDLHVRYHGGDFCVFWGDRFLEAAPSEDAAHARLEVLRRSADDEALLAQAEVEFGGDVETPAE